MRQFLFLFALMLICSPAQARTWYVEKDGSGDFSVIQEAVDVAASRDTIRIGPGHYDDWTQVGPFYNISYPRIYITQLVLTIIGAGADRTVIGQEIPWELEQGNQRGIEVAESFDTIHVEGIRFQNLRTGIFIWTGERSTFKHCEFFGMDIALALGTKTSAVEDCIFQGIIEGGESILSYHQDEILISRCISESDIAWRNKHFGIQGTIIAAIDQCTFRGAEGGISLSRSQNVAIKNCLFEGQTNYGIVLAGSCMIGDCIFRDQGWVFADAYPPGVELKVVRAIIENVSHGTLRGEYLSKGYIRDSILAKGDRGVVGNLSFPAGKARIPNEEPVIFDMKNNWWGTTDPDSINAWIRDAKDDDNINYIIDFEPFNGESVVTEKKSLGDLRSMYR